ncbi:MAG: hypothetical protein CMF61_07710 [Magnetococcales bacterium]|nr:hypothetical protein [Magnetococcales bacterium]
MGSIFKTQSAPPPAPPAPPSTYIDEIGGTEQVPVQNADGTYTYITRRRPLTAEEQAEKDEYDSIMKDALNSIQKLSASDYENDEETQKIIKAWEVENQNILNDNFEERADEEEKILARRGLASSSAGEAARRRRATDKQDANAQLKREKDMLSDDIRTERLALQQNLYNIAASKQDADTAKALKSATSGLSAITSINAGNRASIADYYGRQIRSQNSKLQNSAASMFGDVLSTYTNPVGKIFSIF